MLNTKIKTPKWPLITGKTIIKLIKTYLNRSWSWYERNEIDFIKKFSKIHNVKYVITTTSCTSAIETALQALRIKAGDEVIVPAYTWISTATAIAKIGATPVIVDIDPETLCISPQKIKEAITEKTKAIIPVHLFSAIANMDEINKIAKEHNLKIIEDCAHAHGALYKNKGVGTLSDIGAFSFQQTKLMCCGEGGACTTNNREYAEALDKLNHIGWTIFQNKKNPIQNIPCSKNVLTEFQMAILSDQCDVILNQTKKRMKNAEYLEFLLKDTPEIRFQKTSDGTQRRSYYNFIFLLNLDMLQEGVNRETIINDIKKFGLLVNDAWPVPIYEHELWNLTEQTYRKYDSPITDKISKKEIIALPHYYLLANKREIKKIAIIIKEIVERYKK